MLEDLEPVQGRLSIQFCTIDVAKDEPTAFNTSSCQWTLLLGSCMDVGRALLFTISSLAGTRFDHFSLIGTKSHDMRDESMIPTYMQLASRSAAQSSRFR